jgi:hypothetical protein
MSCEDVSKNSRNNAIREETYWPFLYFSAAFVGVLLLVVGAKSGANFYSRVQRLDSLRVSIQSADRAREALNDPSADITLIESFLLPSPERHGRASAYYNQWRSNKDWSVSFGATTFLESGNAALVERSLQMSRSGQLRLYMERDFWEKQAGTWYQREANEVLLKEEAIPLRGPVLP